jgi:uncharacterized protein
MKNIRLFSLLAATFFLFQNCKTTQKLALAPKTDVGKTENALLWKISGGGLENPSFLYGTIHLIPKKDFEIPSAVRKAMSETKCLTTEIDLAKMFGLGAMFSMLTKINMKGGVTLKSLLSAEDYKLVQTKFAEKGLSMTMFERMKPMFSSMMIGEGTGQEDVKSGATTSVEMEIYEVAKKQKLKTDGLESVDYQISIFDSIPYKDQAKMLVDAVKSGDAGSEEFDKMVKLYLKQDISEMASVAVGVEDEHFNDLLLNNRNRNWIAPMGAQMLKRPTFFAVGAGHLGGEKGVVHLLRSAGWTVEPVKM